MPPRNRIVGDDRARRQIPTELGELGRESDLRSTERDSTRAETLGRIRSFDPLQAALQAGRSQFSQLDEEFDARNSRRNVLNNRRGLFGSPIGLGEQRRDFNERLARAFAGNALNFSQLEGQNIDRLGRVSEADRNESFDTRTRELDFLSATADREQGAENFRREIEERRKARKAKGGGFLGFAKDLIGTVPVIGDAVEAGFEIFDRF